MTKDPPSLPPTPLQRAVEIGITLRALNTAIEEAKIGYSNEHFREIGYAAYEFYESKVFEQLSEERERLRNELNSMFESP